MASKTNPSALTDLEVLSVAHMLALLQNYCELEAARDGFSMVHLSRGDLDVIKAFSDARDRWSK